MSKSEKEKMLSGELYDAYDSELTALRTKIRTMAFKYNRASPKRQKFKQNLLKKMLGKSGNDIYMEAPVYLDYGFNTHIGNFFFANYNTVILDVAPVRIGDNVAFGPNVTIATPMHPLAAEERNSYLDDAGNPHDREYAKAVTIGNNVWIGANVVICGGVTIGDNAVIGAGSVVTRDIAPNMLAVGVPCKPLRSITESDKMLNPD